MVQAGNGASSRGAEKALTEAQLVDLPDTGAFVLPLAAHTFLVGLLVIEQMALIPHIASGNSGVVVPRLLQTGAAGDSSGKSGQFLQHLHESTFDRDGCSGLAS